MKKRKLRKWVKITLYLVVAMVFIDIIYLGLKNYNDYLVNCDNQKGYICNIFGK